MRPISSVLGILVLFSAVSAAGAAAGLTPFVIPPVPDVNSLVAYPPPVAITVNSPHVVASNGHFTVDGKRIKFWAVNLTFAANFPEHADAEQLAVRLSQAGVNCVRMHHMDMFTWEDNHGIWDKANPRKLSSEALDRLDYLLDQLAKHGVYADVNLHVSWTHSKYLALPPVPGVAFDKMTDLFMPQIIDAEKDYARQLLGHVGKYRGVRMADDPAVAIVEISNEDSFFEWGARSHLESMPEPYAGVLQQKFCDWLQHRYRSTDALRAAWNKGASPLGDELLTDIQFESIQKNWPLEVSGASKAAVAATDHAARVDIARVDGTSWHIQFQQRGLHLHNGEYYTLQYSARSDRKRSMQTSVAMAHEPWAGLGFDTTVQLEKDWKTFTNGFVASADDEQARLSFQLGQSTGEVEFKDVSLRTGGRAGLEPDESLDAKNIALFTGGQTPRRALDVPIFLADTEKTFWDGMYRFIKADLHCDAMVTGTIVFGPLGLYGQSDMDFVDAHAYWQHPQFPGRDWDMNNWRINQTAMVDHPEEATLFQLACSRLAGKPFTVTEYCHPAPNDYQAECVPEVSTFAAAQDWDAVFLFDYGAVPNKDHFESFFDIGGNPAKWAFMSSAARIFRNGLVQPPGKSKIVYIAGADDSMDSLAASQEKYGLNMLGAVLTVLKGTWSNVLTSSLNVSISPLPPGVLSLTIAGGDEMKWTATGAHGTFSVLGRNAFVWVGRDEMSSQPMVKLDEPVFAAITLVPIDGEPLATSKRLLITACGRCENTAMRFSADRQTVGKNIGAGPVLIEAVGATLRLPGSLTAGSWQMQALDANGRPKGSAADMPINQDGLIRIDAADQTAWHLLTRN